MIFTSYEFLGFLAVVLAGFNLLSLQYRHWLLLIAGYLFYAYSDWHNLIILSFVTVSAFLAGRALKRAQSLSLLVISIITVLTPLLIMKASGLFDSTSNDGAEGFMIPLGLSFYSLQAVGYLLEVHWRTVEAEEKISSFALYLAFFPIMLSGPIERPGSLLPQLKSLSTTRCATAFLATKQLLWGFFCKLVLADKLALVVSDVFAKPDSRSGAVLLLALLLYSLQIYFDFYGYTTIAIAVSRLFGIEVRANFDHPYLATSIRDFWHRWHISLSTWFRDYVYLPLGGSHRAPASYVVIVLLVFTLSGLWHGASPNFLVWGAVQAILYLLGRWTSAARNRLWDAVLPCRLRWARRLLQACFVFVVISLTWVFFAAHGLEEAALILKKIFSANLFASWITVAELLFRPDYAFFIALAVVFFVIDSIGTVREVVECVPESRTDIARELLLVNSLIVLTVLTGDIGMRGFVYLQF